MRAAAKNVGSMALRFEYNPELDGLRAVAVVLVISDHCCVPVFDQGYFGVDLFFVLSGFLITRLLIDEIDDTGRVDLWRFYLRRLLRLAPPLLLFLTAYMLIAPRLWPQFDLLLHMRDAALAVFYLSDYSQAFWHNPKVLIHTWSLSVEEHFYLIWPFCGAAAGSDRTPLASGRSLRHLLACQRMAHIRI